LRVISRGVSPAIFVEPGRNTSKRGVALTSPWLCGYVFQNHENAFQAILTETVRNISYKLLVFKQFIIQNYALAWPNSRFIIQYWYEQFHRLKKLSAGVLGNFCLKRNGFSRSLKVSGC
jgi:hypothetical protein